MFVAKSTCSYDCCAWYQTWYQDNKTGEEVCASIDSDFTNFQVLKGSRNNTDEKASIDIFTAFRMKKELIHTIIELRQVAKEDIAYESQWHECEDNDE